MKADAINAIVNGGSFVKRLPHDWKITSLRTSIYRFFYQMLLPYLSVYTLALGATATELGIVNSVGMAVAGVVSLFIGWAIDLFGTKKIYLVGILFLAASWAIYAGAQGWTIIIGAMLAYWIGYRVTMTGCAVICANSLSSGERATAMSCCESLAAGLLGLAGPLLGSVLVTVFGGVNVSGMRPLFVISLIGTLASLVLIIFHLSNRKWATGRSVRPSLIKDFSRVFRQGKNLKRFIVISTITFLPTGMIIPFTQPFANEIKGADQYILGSMVAGFSLTPLVLGIPLGRLADRIGRKKALYLMAPLFWASNLLLIWANGPGMLIAAGILQGVLFVNLVINAAMQFELVAAENMGKWLGISGFFWMLTSAVSAFLAGVIWDRFGPQYVFLIMVGLDALVRIPLLISMPETLKPRPTELPG